MGSKRAGTREPRELSWVLRRIVLHLPMSRTPDPNLGVTLGGRFLWVQRLRFKVKLFRMVIVKCDVSCDKQAGFSCLVIDSLVRLEPRKRLLPT